MRKALKFTLITVLALLALFLLAVAVLLWRPGAFVAIVDGPIRASTGYGIAVEDVGITLSPVRVTASGLRLTNPAWEDRPLLLQAGTARLDFELKRALAGELPYWRLRASGAQVYLETNAGGKLNWQTDTGGDDDGNDDDAPFEVSFEHVVVDGGKIHYRESGTTRTLLVNRVEAARRGPRALSLDGSGSYDNMPVAVEGWVELPSAHSEMLALNLSASGLGIEMNADGTLNTASLAGSDLEARLRSDSLATLEQFLSTGLPDAAPLDVSLRLQGLDAGGVDVELDGTMSDRPVSLNGTVARPEADEGLEKLQVDLQGNALGVFARAEGMVNLAVPNRDTDLRVSARAESLDRIEKVLRATLPPVTPLNVSMHFKGDQGAWVVPSLEIEAAKTSLTGSGRYAPGDRKLDLSLEAGEIRLASLMPEGWNEENGESGAGKQNGPSRSPREGALHWQWLQDANATVDVRVEALWTADYLFRDLEAHVEAANGNISIEPIAARVGALSRDDDREPEMTDRLRVNGTVSPLGMRTEGRDVSVDLTLEEPGMTLRIAGEANVNGFGHQSLEIDGRAEKLDTLARLLSIDIAFLAPVALDAKIRGERSSARLDPLSITVQGSDATGAVGVDWSGQRVRIDGELTSNMLDVDGFRAVDPEQKPEEKDAGSRVFSDEPINFDWMDGFAVDLSTRFGELVVNQTTFRNVEMAVVLDTDGLTLEPVRADLTKGGVRGRFALVRTSNGVEYATRFSVMHLSPADLGQENQGFLDGGHSDLDIDVTGRGASPHELAASMNGDLVVEIQNSTIRNDVFEVLGSDLLTQFVTSIVPFVKRDDVTKLQCGAVHFEAKDGVLTSDKQIVLETDKMKVVGGGVINLNNEKIEIGFSPKARKGIGVSIGSVATFVRLGGTLSDPKPETDPDGLLKSGATIGAAAATGGVSLLVQGLIDRVTSGGTACGQIFEKEADVPDAIDPGSGDGDANRADGDSGEQAADAEAHAAIPQLR